MLRPRCSGVPCSHFPLPLLPRTSKFQHDNLLLASTYRQASKIIERHKKWKVKTRSARSDLLFRGVIHAVWNGSLSPMVSGTLMQTFPRRHADSIICLQPGQPTDFDLFTTLAGLRPRLFEVTLHLRKQNSYGQSWIIIIRYLEISYNITRFPQSLSFLLNVFLIAFQCDIR